MNSSDDDSQSGPLKNNITFQEVEKVRKKLTDLKIDDNQGDKKQSVNSNSGSDAAKGLAAGMHIFSGVLVGGLIGYGIDYLFDTLPFGTVIMMPVGMIAGFRNMLRSLEK